MKRDFFPVIAGMFIVLVLVMISIAVYAGIKNENNRISEGIIVDKQISEGYTYANLSKQGGGDYRVYPKEYLFQIEGEKDGETVRYWTNVSAEEYDRYKVGDFYRK